MSNAPTEALEQTLRHYLLHAQEQAVFHALPRQIADALESEPRATLEALVQAMFRGDAVLHWEIYCSKCQFWNVEPDWLQHAQHEYVCPVCGRSFDVHMDDEVQVTFSPHPQLRALGPDAEDRAYRREMSLQFPPTTVHELMTVQTFRDWAQNEPLPSGEHLEIRRATVWFSDLRGSTALYARNGDPLAYDLVREHFDLVFDAINQCQGAVVKTLGDGIMAVFISNSCAIEAARHAHRALGRFNRQRDLSPERCLALKVGIHAGPSILVTLNDRLDYFGTTVNIASRVEHLALGKQTLYTEPVHADPDVQAIIADTPVESFRSTLRGLEQSLTIYCLQHDRD